MELNLPVLTGSGEAPRSARRRSRRLRSDLRLLVKFIEVHCRGLHGAEPKDRLRVNGPNQKPLPGSDVPLCAECRRLLAHALVKRTHCPYDPKPMCKKCPTLCYAPRYREAMRAVMRYSGRKLVLSGRLDYLFHLFF